MNILYILESSFLLLGYSVPFLGLDRVPHARALSYFYLLHVFKKSLELLVIGGKKINNFFHSHMTCGSDNPAQVVVSQAKVWSC